MRGGLFFLGVIFSLAGLFVLSLLVGARATDPGEVLRIMPQAVRLAFDADFAASQPFNDLQLLIAGRVPRAVLAIFAGGALGAAGALMQGFTRNPLADPGILGVNAGAAAAIAIALTLGIVSSPTQFLWPALVGALATTVVVFLLAARGRGAGSYGPLAYVLAGMALTALLMSVVNALMLQNAAVLDMLRVWSTGSVAGRDLAVARSTVVVLILGLIASVFLGRTLNLLSLGDDIAASLGINVVGAQLMGLLTISVLGAVAVSCAGPVMFIGLAAPHMVRSLTGPDYRQIIPLSICLGAVLALVADILGRLLAQPGELPMGIVLALMGVPLFITLVRRGFVRGGV